MRRLGVLTLCALLFAAGASAAAVRADSAPAPETTTTGTTSTDETTTVATTTTSVTTTVATTVTTTTAPPPAKTLGSSVQPAARRCLVAGGVALLAPGQPARALGPLAQAPATRVGGTGAVAYPADGSIVAAASIELHADGCGRAAGGGAVVRGLSLFGGAITARKVELDARVAGSGVSGLEIGGKAVGAAAGRRLPVEDWAYVVVVPQPLPGASSVEASALAVHLLRPHAGLAAGTSLLVAFAGIPRPPKSAPAKAAPKAEPKPKAKAHPRTKRPRARVKHKHVHRRSPAEARRHRELVQERLGEPLSVTPPLRARRYVFPVAGASDYGDSYGAFRGDVPGSWHHGDDIFAALGTPVVAVATGTLNRVGWQRLGGWRLWVRDSRGNEFYYAHLSGYSPLALRSRQVSAGDVIGFVGNTGDAFTTPPHVHFEIHPRRLLHLGYNGAVDPTAYLAEWRHLEHVHAPRPAHPAFPPGAVRREASYVWRELLASRGLIRHAPSPKERPKLALPAGALDVQPPRVRRLSLSAGAAATGGGTSTSLLASLLAAMAAALAGAMVVRRRLPASRLAAWRRPATPSPETSEDGTADDLTVSRAVERLAAVARSLRARP